MIPAADQPRIAAALAATVAPDVNAPEADFAPALAYIATAEGTAAQMAERACDRLGLDFAACPPEILDAAARRAEELARAFLAEQVAVRKAAWSEYEAAAAPLTKRMMEIRRAAPRGRTSFGAEYDALEARDQALVRTRNATIEQIDSALQERFGSAAWTGMDNGRLPPRWKP